MGRQDDREAGAAEHPEHGVVMAQRGRPRRRPRLQSADRPGVAQQSGRGPDRPRRMAVVQPPSSGTSISPNTTSTMPSRMSSLLATWWYSDIASTPSSWASRRIVSASMPSRSATATATRHRPRSRVVGSSRR